MSIYIEMEDVTGDVATLGYEGQMEIESLKFNVQSGGRVLDKDDLDYGLFYNDPGMSSASFISTITVSKLTDRSTTSLLKAAMKRDVFPTVKIRFVRIQGSASLTVIEYELGNCIISDYTVSASNKADSMVTMPEETLSLSFSKIKHTFIQVGVDGRPAGKETIAYNLNSGQVL